MTNQKDDQTHQPSMLYDIDYKQELYTENINRKASDFQKKINDVSSVIIIVLALMLIFYGLFNQEKNAFKSLKDNVNILIVDENGEPIKQAKISFIGDDYVNYEFTDSTGYVGIENIKSYYNKIDILIKKEGFKPIIEEINLDNKSVTNKIFKLEKVVDKQ